MLTSQKKMDWFGQNWIITRQGRSQKYFSMRAQILSPNHYFFRQLFSHGGSCFRFSKATELYMTEFSKTDFCWSYSTTIIILSQSWVTQLYMTPPLLRGSTSTLYLIFTVSLSVFWVIVFIRRDSNKMAHTFAIYALSISEDKILPGYFPYVILDVAFDDGTANE